MHDNNLELPFWEGFSIWNFDRRSDGIWISLVPVPGNDARCSNCSAICPRLHGRYWRTVRDMSLLGEPVWLQVNLRRVRCADCGTCAEQIDWLDRHARVTRRLAQFVGLWCEKLPVAHVCQLTGLHWETVRRIERARLIEQLATMPAAQPSKLVMDEFALFKGHRYATVVLDADTRQVLWVGEGRSR
ncbi:helix-turn-helix domain-containing protein, partial [Pseudoduganella aquatica]